MNNYIPDYEKRIDRIRFSLRVLDLTYDDLAKRIGTTKQTISNILLGHFKCSLCRLIAIEYVLGINDYSIEPLNSKIDLVNLYNKVHS